MVDVGWRDRPERKPERLAPDNKIPNPTLYSLEWEARRRLTERVYALEPQVAALNREVWKLKQEEPPKPPKKENAVSENGKWVEVTGDEHAEARHQGRPGRMTYRGRYLEADVTYEVWQEELPLPDKPGVRFWGRTTGTGEPCWWFSVKANGAIAYISEDRINYYPGYAAPGVPEALTRLPDPKD